MWCRHIAFGSIVLYCRNIVCVSSRSPQPLHVVCTFEYRVEYTCMWCARSHSNRGICEHHHMPLFLAHSTTESCIDGLNSVEKVSSQRKNARSCAADTTCVICVTYNARVVRTEFQIANNRKKTWYWMFPSWVACVSKCAVAVAIRLNECRTEPGGQRLHAEVSRLRISWYLHVLYSNMESSIIF